MESANRRLSTVCNHLTASAQSTPETLLFPQVTSNIDSNKLLKGQVAIITGSGQGIGGATAKLYAAHGAKVVVTDLDKEKSDRMAQEIITAGGEAISFAGDVTDPDFPEAIVKATIQKWGKLNILVNNAGYTWDGVVHKMTDKQWDAMLKVHNTAPFRLIRAASPYMRDASKEEMDKGKTPEPRCIINVSSTSGLHGNFGQANYATAKMGVVGLTKTIAKEWGAFGVRCNAIAYGFIDTRLTQDKKSGAFIEVDGKKIPLGIPVAQEGNRDHLNSRVPLGRSGTVDEAAGAMLMLASPYANFVHGHTLEVTGGMGI
jgi:3-oxoacyl-[acyl-carrier protein] reductase